MEIKERVTKSGANAGKTYFFIEVEGEVHASRDRRTLETLMAGGRTTVTGSKGGWTWHEGDHEHSTDPTQVDEVPNRTSDVLQRLVSILTKEEREQLRGLL